MLLYSHFARGLGKTIEADLVISQKWAERQRHILIIPLATLRKQWSMELAEEFLAEAKIEKVDEFTIKWKLA